MKTTLLILVRNEIESLPQIMPKIDSSWVDEILFVDGQSTDGTPEWLEKNGYTVFRQKRKGIGAAYWESLPVVKGDVVIAFSPDGNSLPELIPTLVTKMKEGHDMVIVSRYTGGAKSDDDDIATRFGNWMFTKLVNICFRGKYTDSLVMFRAFRRDLPYEMGMKEDGIPVFEYDLCIYCAKQGRRVADIPGDEPKRIGDVRKMSPIYNGSCILYALARGIFTGRSPARVAPKRPAEVSSPATLRRVK